MDQEVSSCVTLATRNGARIHDADYQLSLPRTDYGQVNQHLRDIKDVLQTYLPGRGVEAPAVILAAEMSAPIRVTSRSSLTGT